MEGCAAQLSAGNWNVEGAALKDPPGVEPSTVVVVRSFHVFHILTTNESEDSMEFGIVAKFRRADCLFDFVHQSLVFGAVFFKIGKSIPAQRALFATEVHVCELDQPSHLFIQPRAAVATRQLMPKRIERIQENPMLVIHRLNANGSAKLRSRTCHSSPYFEHLILYRGRDEKQYRFCGVPCDLGLITGSGAIRELFRDRSCFRGLSRQWRQPE
jgi:hypothetical protein